MRLQAGHLTMGYDHGVAGFSCRSGWRLKHDVQDPCNTHIQAQLLQCYSAPSMWVAHVLPRTNGQRPATFDTHNSSATSCYLEVKQSC